MISTLIKPLLPLVRKAIESGKIDELLHQLADAGREKYAVADEDTVDFVLSYNKPMGCWNVVIVSTDKDNVVCPLEFMKLSEVINLILSKI